MGPTSATGAERPAPFARGRAAGVTLLELLVVMVLIALAASAVVLTAAPRQPSLSQEAARLAAQAALAQDEAALSGRSVALRLDAQGYRFERRAGPALWRPLEEPPFGPQEWGEEVRVDFSSRQPVVRIVFDAAGFTEAQTVVLRRGREGARVLFGAEGARVEAIP